MKLDWRAEEWRGTELETKAAFLTFSRETFLWVGGFSMITKRLEFSILTSWEATTIGERKRGEGRGERAKRATFFIYFFRKIRAKTAASTTKLTHTHTKFVSLFFARPSLKMHLASLGAASSSWVHLVQAQGFILTVRRTMCCCSG